MIRGGNAQRFTSVALSIEKRYFLFLEVLRRFDFFFVFLGCPAAANSRRFLEAQPGLFTCRPRPMPSPSAGTFSVITDPAAIYAPSPNRTGATSVESLPTNTRFPMLVGCL